MAAMRVAAEVGGKEVLAGVGGKAPVEREEAAASAAVATGVEAKMVEVAKVTEVLLAVVMEVVSQHI